MKDMAAMALLDKLVDMGLSYPYQLPLPHKTPVFVFELDTEESFFPSTINIVFPTPERAKQVLEVIVDFDRQIYDPTLLYFRLIQTAVLKSDLELFKSEEEDNFTELIWKPLSCFDWNMTPPNTVITFPEWLEAEWEAKKLYGSPVPRIN